MVKAGLQQVGGGREGGRREEGGGREGENSICMLFLSMYTFMILTLS